MTEEEAKERRKDMVCSNCAFFVKHTPTVYGHRDGECRRMPPVFVVHDGDYNSWYPDTALTSWCGEWRAA